MYHPGCIYTFSYKKSKKIWPLPKGSFTSLPPWLRPSSLPHYLPLPILSPKTKLQLSRKLFVKFWMNWPCANRFLIKINFVNWNSKWTVQISTNILTILPTGHDTFVLSHYQPKSELSRTRNRMEEIKVKYRFL